MLRWLRFPIVDKHDNVTVRRGDIGSSQVEIKVTDEKRGKRYHAQIIGNDNSTDVNMDEGQLVNWFNRMFGK